MNYEEYIAIAAMVATVLLVLVVAVIKVPKRLKRERFEKKWKQLQDLCSDETKWPLALQAADNLLDEALKKKKFKGKSMGERLVDAQRKFSNNDAVWYGHKLRTKLDANTELTLTKAEVQKALVGLRQGLKDIGAL